MNAYSTIWLNQALPSFTTAAEALIPFKISSQSEESFSASTLTGRTYMYSSSLKCQPANIEHGPRGITYDNGKGCAIEDIDISRMIPNRTGVFSSYYSANCSNSFEIFVAFAFQNLKPADNVTTLGLNHSGSWPQQQWSRGDTEWS